MKQGPRARTHTHSPPLPLSVLSSPLPIQPAPAAAGSTPCAWSTLYSPAHDAAAQKSAAAQAAMADDPDSPAARPPGVVTVHKSITPSAGCGLADSPDPPSPEVAATLPRVPPALKASLAPLPPALEDSPTDAPADGKTAGGAAPSGGADDSDAHAPARQQLAPPGPPGPIPYNNLVIYNNVQEAVYVVTAGVQFTRPGYWPGVPAQTPADRWAVTGWFKVQPQQKTIVFSTRANKCWFYAQTINGTMVWGGNNVTDVAVYPDDVPFTPAAGGYVSTFTVTPTPDPVIHPYYMQQYNFNNGLFDAINMDGVVTLDAPVLG